MASTYQSKDPFLVRPEEGETADEFANRVMALMGHGKDSTDGKSDGDPADSKKKVE